MLRCKSAKFSETHAIVNYPRGWQLACVVYLGKPTAEDWQTQLSPRGLMFSLCQTSGPLAGGRARAPPLQPAARPAHPVADAWHSGAGRVRPTDPPSAPSIRPEGGGGGGGGERVSGRPAAGHAARCSRPGAAPELQAVSECRSGSRRGRGGERRAQRDWQCRAGRLGSNTTRGPSQHNQCRVKQAQPRSVVGHPAAAAEAAEAQGEHDPPLRARVPCSQGPFCVRPVTVRDSLSSHRAIKRSGRRPTLGVDARQTAVAGAPRERGRVRCERVSTYICNTSRQRSAAQLVASRRPIPLVYHYSRRAARRRQCRRVARGAALRHLSPAACSGAADPATRER